ncbi:MAG: hypothetical protein WD850_02695 [Candidatus Spechtbacterales bacterium]
MRLPRYKHLAFLFAAFVGLFGLAAPAHAAHTHPVVETGEYCTVSFLEPIFGSEAAHMATICSMEGVDDAQALNISCADPNFSGPGQPELSAGLFQINLLAENNPVTCVQLSDYSSLSQAERLARQPQATQDAVHRFWDPIVNAQYAFDNKLNTPQGFCHWTAAGRCGANLCEDANHPVHNLSCEIFSPAAGDLPSIDIKLELQWPTLPGINRSLNDIVAADRISWPALITFIYALALWIGGILAFIMVVYVGFGYILSGESATMRSNARQRLIGVVIGIVLLLVAVILLRLLNPDLVILRELNLDCPPGVTCDYDLRAPRQGNDASVKVPGTDLTCAEVLVENDPSLKLLAESLCSDGTVTEGEVKKYLDGSCGNAYIQEDVDVILAIATQQCTVPGGIVGAEGDQIELTETTMGALCTANTGPGETFAGGELFNPYASARNGGTLMNITNPSAQEGAIRELLAKNLSAVQEFCSEEDPNSPSLAGRQMCSIGDATTTALTVGQKNSIVDYCFQLIPKI